MENFKQANIKDVILICCNLLEVDYNKLLSKKRTSFFYDNRHAIFTALHDYGYKKVKIAEAFNIKQISTINNAIQTTKNKSYRIKYDKYCIILEYFINFYTKEIEKEENFIIKYFLNDGKNLYFCKPLNLVTTNRYYRVKGTNIVARNTKIPFLDKLIIIFKNKSK